MRVLSVEFSFFTYNEIPVGILNEFLQILFQKVRLEMLKTTIAPSIRYVYVYVFSTSSLRILLMIA